VPVETLRTHYSAIARRIIKGGLPGNLYHALENVRAAIDKQIIAGIQERMDNPHPLYEAAGGAPVRDLISEYEKLKADEYQFLTDWEGKIKSGGKRVKSPLAEALEQIDPNFLGPKIAGKGSEFIAKQLGQYQQYGADTSLLGKALRIADEAKAAASAAKRVTVPKETPPTEPPKSEPAPIMPEYPGKKPLPPSATAPQTSSARVELKPVERPSTKLPKAGRVSLAVARIIGKLTGGVVGSLMPGPFRHPFLGWTAGGELAPEILNRIVGKQTAKAAIPVTAADMSALTPVEKTGIQNGIANRLIAIAERGEPTPPLQKFENVLTKEQMQRVMQAAMKGKVAPTP
jgi:hypothetical protein